MAYDRHFFEINHPGTLFGVNPISDSFSSKENRHLHRLLGLCPGPGGEDDGVRVRGGPDGLGAEGDPNARGLRDPE